MKTGLLIGGVVLILFTSVFLLAINSKKNPPGDLFPSPQTQSSSSLQTSSLSSQASVPLPQETDIIRSFFNLIEEKKISEAVGMMSDAINSDDSKKQGWGAQLRAMKSVQVLDIVPSMPEEWKNNMHVYKVTLDVVMNSSSANQPIPYYGFEKGNNIRWIPLEKSGNTWKIAGLATGP